jgi:hypothetical protein
MSLDTLTNFLLLYVERQVTGLGNGLKSLYTRQRFMRRFLLPRNEVANRLFDSTENIRVFAFRFSGRRNSCPPRGIPWRGPVLAVFLADRESRR